MKLILLNIVFQDLIIIEYLFAVKLNDEVTILVIS